GSRRLALNGNGRRHSGLRLAVGQGRRRGGALSVAELDRQRKKDVLLKRRTLFDVDAKLVIEELEAGIDQVLRRASSGGDGRDFDFAEPRQIDVSRAIDQIRRHTVLRGNLLQTVAVGAVLAANDEDQLNLRQNRLQRLLPVLR